MPGKFKLSHHPEEGELRLLLILFGDSKKPVLRGDEERVVGDHGIGIRNGSSHLVDGEA